MICFLLLGFQQHNVITCACETINFIEYGLWPVKMGYLTFISFETMSLLSTLTQFSPVTSLTSIVNALNFNTRFNLQVRHVAVEKCSESHPVNLFIS